MFLPKRINTFKLPALLLLCTAANISIAQKVYHNQYPCAECAVLDNNGNDLITFINSNKTDAENRGSKVNEYSGSNWGYLQIKTGKVPSVNSRGEHKSDLNYYESIRATFALYKAFDGVKATWWARESNLPEGALTYLKVDDHGKLPVENVRYTQITHELENKTFTLVEYDDTDYNQKDYDVLLKNYILLERGTIKNPNNYKYIISFYNDFLDKFTTVNDAILANRSFITLFTINNTKYIGYFNIVNGKLSGHLGVLDLQYEGDKESVINQTMQKLTGTRIYVYGDQAFGMEKAFSKYARSHNVKIRPWKTTEIRKFNTDRFSTEK